MYTEYSGQNISNNNQAVNGSQKNNSNQKLNDDKKSIANKFLSIIWKVSLVLVVISFSFVLLIQFGVISFASKVLPNAIIFNQNEIGIKTGNGYQLVTTVLPVNAENKQIKYVSSDPSVAKVNEVTGYIEAIKNGTAVITAKTLINEKSVECIVNVGDTNIPVKNLSIKQKIVNLAAGYTSALSYNVTPKNATELSLNFTSSDPSIATVNSNGIITAHKEGTVTITAATNNNTVEDQVDVTVYKPGTVTVVDGDVVKTTSNPTSISIPTKKEISVGGTWQIEPKVLPADATSELSFISSNPSVATVNSDGVVKALGVGTADITATTINGLSSTCTVTVGNYSVDVKKITITTRYSFLQIGQKKKLYVSYEPTNASNPNVTWSSSNSSIVSVDEAGNIVAKSSGHAKIKATATSTGYTDEIDIEVGGGSVIELKKMTLGKSPREVYIGSTEQVTPVFDPQNATYTSVTYISSNPGIASVDSSGKVLGVKEGTAVITVKVNRSSISENVTINVKNNPAQSVTLNSTNVTLDINKTFTLTSTVYPATASIKTVTYKSSDSNIATVDQQGIIKGISRGTTTITVTPNGGGTPSTCLVTVK